MYKNNRNIVEFFHQKSLWDDVCVDNVVEVAINEMFEINKMYNEIFHIEIDDQRRYAALNNVDRAQSLIQF